MHNNLVCGREGSPDSLGDVKTVYLGLVAEAVIRTGAPVATRVNTDLIPAAVASVEVYTTDPSLFNGVFHQGISDFWAVFRALHTRCWVLEATVLAYLRARVAEGTLLATAVSWATPTFGNNAAQDAAAEIDPAWVPQYVG